MCGIAGLLAGQRVDRGLVREMTRSIAHRGPDDEGLWVDEDAQVALGHRRLSIVDLSPLGHQPMESRDGRYVLDYNGEVYNHVALRAELDAIGPREWRGHSDTEVLVEAISEWGFARALQKSVGQFAIALWDRKERKLHLARDRFGEKPLYYGWVGGDFVFASELKAMRVHPGFSNPVNRTALQLLASRTYIPAPLSIFERIFKLVPGCILTVSPAAVGRPRSEPPEIGESGDLALERYWSYREVVEAGLADPYQDEAEALAALNSALSESIAGQSMADVPVGAFLSGGFDSSTVVALYQRHSSVPIRTFSIGFEEQGYDEAGYARAVARHFGTSHNERYVTVREAQELLPALPSMYDEPFADSSQIPTHLVSRFAREQVTVALSGDGGDELFGGYNRYFGTARLWSWMERLPAPARKMVGRSFSRMPPSAWNRLVNVLPAHRQPPHFGYKVQKAFRTMGHAASMDDVFNSFLDEWHELPSPVLGRDGGTRPCPFDLDVGGGASDVVRMMYCDAVSYLPDDILCKVDRASMAVSLESRVPFLDHRVAAVAARIPQDMKIRGGKGKMILRKLLYQHAPAEMFERPKAGFGFPVGQWIKGELRPWAEELLDERRLREDGYFDVALVRRRWADHLNGVRDAGFSIWAILMFQAWNQHWQSAAEPEPMRAAG